MAFLSPPDVSYRESYLDALREYHDEGRHLEMDRAWVAHNFETFVRDRLLRADPAHVLPYLVPESEFWLIDGGEYVGTTRIRHRLNDRLRRYGGHIGYEIRPSWRRRGYGREILRLALLEAGRLGLTRALVTCSRDNTASRKIIEANGGVFEGEDDVRLGDRVHRERRYWIEIEPQSGRQR